MYIQINKNIFTLVQVIMNQKFNTHDWK